MRISMALMSTALLIGFLVSSWTTGGRPTSTATLCAFVERCRNPALTTEGTFDH
jgi:hypothetical protein